MNKFLKIKDWLFSTRAMRAYMRYGSVRANLLAGGIAYTTLFSLAGIITLLIMSARVVLTALPQQANELYAAINQWMPGLLKINGKPGVFDPSLIASSGFTWGTVVVFAVSLVAGLRVVTALRLAIQQTFGLPSTSQEFWKGPVRDLISLLIIGLGVLLILFLSSGTVIVLHLVTSWLSIDVPVPHWLINLSALLLTTLATAGLVAMILRYLSLVRAPLRDLWPASLVLGFIVTSLQMSSVYLVSSLSPMLASFTVLLTLILWVNVVARMFLYTCCWIANPPLAEVIDENYENLGHRPNFVTLSCPETLQWAHDPVSGRILSTESIEKSQASKGEANEDNHD